MVRALCWRGGTLPLNVWGGAAGFETLGHGSAAPVTLRAPSDETVPEGGVRRSGRTIG